MRICSLLPSATEIVYALGLGDGLVGVTHECDYPPEAAALPPITSSAIDHIGSPGREIHDDVSRSVHSGSSLYTLDHERLGALSPDVILTQELCDVCAVSYGVVEKAVRLLDADTKVLSLEPTSLRGILDTIEEVARVAGVPERAGPLVEGLQARIDRVAHVAEVARSRPRVVTLEWLDPPFVGGHWVPEMVRLAGGTNGLGREGAPSYRVAWDDIAAYDPEAVVLMPCGFDLEASVAELERAELPEAWRGLAAVRSGQVYAVDGSAYFNRPGPRIVDGLEILAEIIQPALFPRSKPPEAWRRLAAARE